MEVPLVKLSNGRTMPAVGFGTWRCDPDKLAEAVATALRAGVRHIDTAGIYRNEGLLGKEIAAAIRDGVLTREELFVASKLGMTQVRGDAAYATARPALYIVALHVPAIGLPWYPRCADVAGQGGAGHLVQPGGPRHRLPGPLHDGEPAADALPRMDGR
jgi:hypothetical protein